jgi:hypothetical protein
MPLDETAYSYLLGLYLGDGCISAHPRGVYKLRIVLDIRYPNIIHECRVAMASMKPAGLMVPGTVAKEGCLEIYALWKHWPCLFPQHGPGKKHERKIVLAEWQNKIVEKHPQVFLRGLIHSDGWRGTNKVTRTVGGVRKVYLYPRYQFVNYSSDIRHIFCWACDIYGIEWKQMKWNAISIARRSDVQKLDAVIGQKT